MQVSFETLDFCLQNKLSYFVAERVKYFFAAPEEVSVCVNIKHTQPQMPIFFFFRQVDYHVCKIVITQSCFSLCLRDVLNVVKSKEKNRFCV